MSAQIHDLYAFVGRLGRRHVGRIASGAAVNVCRPVPQPCADRPRPGPPSEKSCAGDHAGLADIAAKESAKTVAGKLP